MNVKCPECGTKISSHAAMCQKCGLPARKFYQVKKEKSVNPRNVLMIVIGLPVAVGLVIGLGSLNTPQAQVATTEKTATPETDKLADLQEAKDYLNSIGKKCRQKTYSHQDVPALGMWGKFPTLFLTNAEWKKVKDEKSVSSAMNVVAGDTWSVIVGGYRNGACLVDKEVLTSDNEEPSQDWIGSQIKISLRQYLNDPGSLQDFSVLSMSKVDTREYEATVQYRAKNSFGALVVQQNTFLVKRDPDAMLGWVAVPKR